MEILSSFIQSVVAHIYDLTRIIGEPNYGLAIIIMTILIKLILAPLTAKQIASTRAMTKIQPKMKELQARYKDDKQMLNQKLSELYRQEGVNPLAGCLPLVIQMPILIGIFMESGISIMKGPVAFCGWRALPSRIRIIFCPCSAP